MKRAITNRPMLYRLTMILAAICEPDGQPVKNPQANCARLAEELEVSTRTVLRDFDFLRDSLCLPIEYEPAQHTFHLTRPARVDLGRLLVLTGGAKS